MDPKQAYDCALKYAKFSARRYKEIDDHTKSQYFQLQLEALETWKKESNNTLDRDDRRRREREMEVEKADVERVRSERNKFLISSAKNFMKALSLISEDELIIPHLTAMLIQNTTNAELMQLVAVRLFVL
jgi:hypothetical protein